MSCKYASGVVPVQTGGVVSEWVAGKVARELVTVLALTSPVWLVMLFTHKRS